MLHQYLVRFPFICLSDQNTQNNIDNHIITTYGSMTSLPSMSPMNISDSSIQGAWHFALILTIFKFIRTLFSILWRNIPISSMIKRWNKKSYRCIWSITGWYLYKAFSYSHFVFIRIPTKLSYSVRVNVSGGSSVCSVCSESIENSVNSVKQFK